MGNGVTISLSREYPLGDEMRLTPQIDGLIVIYSSIAEQCRRRTYVGGWQMVVVGTYGDSFARCLDPHTRELVDVGR